MGGGGGGGEGMGGETSTDSCLHNCATCSVVYLHGAFWPLIIYFAACC